MEDIITCLTRFLEQTNDTVIYLTLFFSAVLENLIPPVPGDTITAFGAFLVGTGRLDFFMVYAATTAGSVLGFLVLVGAGRLLGRHFFTRRQTGIFSPDDIIRAENWFSRYGYLVILGNRFLPGIRSVISITAGIARLDLPKTAIYAAISAAAWNLVWISAGYLIGGNWERVKTGAATIMRNYNIAAGIIMGAVIIYLLVKKRK